MSNLTHEEEVTLALLLKKRDGEKLIHVLQVLDRSWSMNTGKDITINAFNENLRVMQMDPKAVGKTSVSLITFNKEVRRVYANRPVGEAPLLTEETYVPDGGTALYDGIGDALALAKSLPKYESAQFLLQIFTDGEENESRVHTMWSLKEQISQLNATGRWTITVMGPKGQIDLFAKNVGIHKGNTAQFNPSSLRSRSLGGAVLNSSTASYFAAAAVGQTALHDSYAAVAPTGNVDDVQP